MAYVSTIISKAAPVSDLEFNLDNVSGRVVTCEEVTIPTSQTVVMKGLTTIQNRSVKDMNLKPCTEIGTVITANIVLTTQVSNDFDLDEQKRVSCMTAQLESANILEETHHGSTDPKDILQKLNLSGLEEWEPHLQQEA